MCRVANIVVVLPNWLRDVVMATPALRALRKRFSTCRITHFGRDLALEILGGLDLADIFQADMSRRDRSIAGLTAAVNTLRAGRCDLAVLFPNSFRSAVLVRMAGIRRIFGYNRDGRGWLLSDSLSPPRDEDGSFEPISAIDYYNNLAALLGVKNRSRQMILAIPPADIDAAEGLLHKAGADSTGPIVMLNPGASFGVSKMWDPDRYAAVADKLIERRQAQIIINAAPNERLIADQVGRAMQHRPLINFAYRANSIRMLKALAGRCDLVITNDTGARHVAAALGTPVVTLFGSTNPQWARIDYDRERIIRVEVPCSPCQKKMCSQPAGPLYHQCMKAITVDMVTAAAEELLDASVASYKPAPRGFSHSQV